GYGSVALLLGTGAPPELLRTRIESSFGQYQNLKKIREMEAEVRALEDASERAHVYEAPCGDFARIGRYRRARQEVEARRQALGRMSVPELIERERAQGPEAVLSSIECHRCPWGATTRCEHASRDLERLQERLGQRRAALDAFRNAYWQEFLRVVEVLEQFGAVRDGRLEAKGRLVASLRHDNELLLAETVTRGLFDDLTLAEAAALCAALLEESRSGEPTIARAFLKKRPKLKQRLDRLVAAADAVWQAQRARQLGVPVNV